MSSLIGDPWQQALVWLQCAFMPVSALKTFPDYFDCSTG